MVKLIELDSIRVRQCQGTTKSGKQCQRRALANWTGYICADHEWQVGVEEGSR